MNISAQVTQNLAIAKAKAMIVSLEFPKHYVNETTAV